MRPLLFSLVLLLVAVLLGFSQIRRDERDIKLPSGKSQKEEILRADHEKSLEDASKLMELSEELKIELEKNDRHVLSISTLKKLDDMEKLVKRIRSRLKRY